MELKISKELICLECGKVFLFSVGEQEFYGKRKLLEPKRCPHCRQLRRKMKEAINNA